MVKGSGGMDSVCGFSRLKAWVVRFLVAALMVICCPLSVSARDTAVVRVGVYEFPPFVSIGDQGQVTGLVPDLLTKLNQAQQQYHFVLRQTSPKRRYHDFMHHHFDLILFENPNWGWQSLPHLRTRLLMESREVYIAYRLPDRTQRFFDDLKDKRLLGILGYHYGFAGFNANEHYLHQHFHITLTDDLDHNIRVILANRPDLAQVAIVPYSFLKLFERNNPGVAERLLVSRRIDPSYRLYGILRMDGPISPGTFDQLLEPLENNGVLHRLEHRYDLSGMRRGQATSAPHADLTGNQVQTSASPPHP